MAVEQAALPGLGARRPIRADDLFALTMIGDVAVSPDGQVTCFVQTRMDREANEYRSDLWTVPAAGGPGEAVQLTHGPRTVAQPRWAPNGRWLAFLTDRDERGRRQLWILPTHGIGGEARRLTSGEGSVSDYTWAPDSTMLAFVRVEKVARDGAPTARHGEPDEDDGAGVNGAVGERDRAAGSVATGRVADDVVTIDRIRHKADGVSFTHDRRSHLWTVDLEGHETRLTAGDYDDRAPTSAPDCRSIAFVSQRPAQGAPGDETDFTNAAGIWIVGTDGGEPRELPTPDGPVDAPAWSPDGRLIAYIGSDRANRSGGNADLWIVPADGTSDGAPRNLTAALDLSMGLGVGSDSRAGLSTDRPVWSPDCAALYVVASTHGDSPLWRVPVDQRGGEAPRRVVGEEGAAGVQVQSFALCAGGTTLALGLADALNPGDVYCADPAGGALRRLTDVNGAWLAGVELVEPEPFWFEGAEGWPVHGWLMRPAGDEEGAATTYPLVLEIHGGPHAAYGNTFFFEFQLLAAQGWGVLFTNPRGSTGYGERFTMASNGDWGGADYRDLMAGVDAALARAPWIDRTRLGVIGGSYGGYMTNWIVTQTDRFRAAVTQRSLCNLVSKWGTSDIGYLGNDLQWGGPPWENLQFYLDRSPLTHVRNVSTPLLILHSERDLRCPIEQGEQFFTALKYLRRAVEFVRFPDEGHELSRSGQPLHRLERLERIVGWFHERL